MQRWQKTPNQMRKLLFVLIIIGCSREPEPLPTCDWVSAKFNGSKIALQIHSDSDQVQYCREYVSGTRCFTIRKEYFSCISIAADYGDILTFVDNGIECTIQAE